MTTFNGNEIKVIGNAVKVGDIAPEFRVIGNDFSPVNFSSFKGIKVISVVPSLDTGVCDVQTRNFNEHFGKYENVTVLTISTDLPPAQARWCGAAGVDKVVTLSDHFDLDFGMKYGFVLEALRLLTRGMLVVDENNVIVHYEMVGEVTNAVDFDAVYKAVDSLVK